MGPVRFGLMWFGCLLVLAVAAWAQTRKAGLWAMTTTTTVQQTPFPAGMNMPANSPFGGGAHTTEVCVTQAQIDKYGAAMQPSRGDCQMTNVVKTTHGMTADMVCTGRTAGKGTVQANWTDEEHSTGKVHFVGSLQMGPNSKPFEWTSESTSVYKGADCGSVKPLPGSDR